MRLALLATAATLFALPAIAQAPPKPPTALEKAIADLNQSYSGLNGNINALGITANDIRDHQIAGVQANIGAVLAAKTQEDADKLAAQKTADDAALAAAKKATDAKLAAQKTADDAALAAAKKATDAKLAAQKTADDAALAAAKKTAADAEAQKKALLANLHDDTALIAKRSQEWAAYQKQMEGQHATDQASLAALQRRVDDQARQLLHVAQPEPPMCINGPKSPKDYEIRQMTPQELHDLKKNAFPHSEPAPAHK